MLIPVNNSSDPRIEPFINVRDRDLRDGHGGRFVAEGESVLAVLLSSSLYPAESLLVAENRVGTLLGLSPDPALPVYVVAPKLMEEIVGFPIHRGLLGVGSRGAPKDAAALVAERPRLVVGLAGIANHDNVGGIFRNAAAFGADAVLYDAATSDPFYRKALRVSVGGVLKVPSARTASAAELVALLKESGYRAIGLSPRGDTRLDDVPRDRPLGLILGTEGPGLSDEVMAMTETVRIDMPGGFDSLNVATTSGIALYELTKTNDG